MIPARFYTDKKGFRIAEVAPPYELLGRYLSSDVETNSECEELIEHAQNAINGSSSGWEGTGNAFSVTIAPNVVTVSCEYGDRDSVSFPSKDYVDLLISWQDFLNSQTM